MYWATLGQGDYCPRNSASKGGGSPVNANWVKLDGETPPREQEQAPANKDRRNSMATFMCENEQYQTDGDGRNSQNDSGLLGLAKRTCQVNAKADAEYCERGQNSNCQKTGNGASTDCFQPQYTHTRKGRQGPSFFKYSSELGSAARLGLRRDGDGRPARAAGRRDARGRRTRRLGLLVRRADRWNALQ